MWFRDPVPTARHRHADRPPRSPRRSALRAVDVVVVGVYPQLFARIGELASVFAVLSGIDGAGCADGASRERDPSAEGPIRSTRSSSSRSYGDGGFFARAPARAGRGPTSSPAPRSARCSARCVARALDGWWRELGRPDPFVVIEAGAGRGRLAATCSRRSPRARARCATCWSSARAACAPRSSDLLDVEPLEDALGPGRSRDDDDAPVPVTGTGPMVTALDDLPARARSTAW